MYILTNYFSFFLIIIFSFILAFIFIVLAYLVAPKKLTTEKLSAYECGFEPFSTTRRGFDVHFYIIAILFLVFDLEVAYLLPWSVAVDFLQFYGFLTVLFFIVLLTVGFVYEYFVGALKWTKK